MFINYQRPEFKSQKMTSYINLFLKTELTCVPKLLKNYLGNYYNNALCNGATWVFVLWCLLHVIFDRVTDAFFKKLRYKEYVRLRLKNSLWYLGFFSTALIYSGATLAQNEVELFNFKKMHVPSNTDLSMQTTLGYTLISTFYLHCAFWEGLTKDHFINMFGYFCLFSFLVSSHILRVVEISFTLTALIGAAQVAVQFTRCSYMSSNQENMFSRMAVVAIYMLSFALCAALYVFVIPLTFIAPLAIKIMSDYPNILLLYLFACLVCWLIIEVYQSLLFKAADHWLYHGGEIENEDFSHCRNGLLECSLFKPRDDISYNLQIIKQEIKARETKMMSLRKPKNKGMLIQTLKCMVAIKRKLSEKRLSESSDSDHSEITDNNTDDDTKKLQPDQDEESDDEESESQNSVTETKYQNQTEDNAGNSGPYEAVEELIDLTDSENTEDTSDKFVETVREDTKADGELLLESNICERKNEKDTTKDK